MEYTFDITDELNLIAEKYAADNSTTAQEMLYNYIVKHLYIVQKNYILKEIDGKDSTGLIEVKAALDKITADKAALEPKEGDKP